jgi:transcriptional regulator with XRE-family HTH domain
MTRDAAVFPVMAVDNELGTYLRARRERVTPADVGLAPGRGIRRTPGLRREELATLAGVSIDYYARLERGKERRPSTEVLDAIAGVLQLCDDARGHLHALADRAARTASSVRAPSGHAPSSRAPAGARPTTLLLLDAVRPNAAIAVDRYSAVLAANPGGLALYPGLADFPGRNIIRYLFLHPAARDLWGQDWERQVSGTIANLRAIAGTEPDSPELAALVGELSVKSRDFARLWDRYDVLERTAGVKQFTHPSVGRMRLEYESMPLAGTDGHRVVIYLAEPGTADHDAMVLLDLTAAGDAAREGSSRTRHPSSGA